MPDASCFVTALTSGQSDGLSQRSVRRWPGLRELPVTLAYPEIAECSGFAGSEPRRLTDEAPWRMSRGLQLADWAGQGHPTYQKLNCRRRFPKAAADSGAAGSGSQDQNLPRLGEC